MSTDVRKILSQVFAEPPDDLVAMYEGGELPHDDDLRINVLPLEQAVKDTRGMRGVGLFGSMGLFWLDDANDSNPYCYVTKGPARGCILHLNHEGVVGVEYPSLAAWLAALRAAVEAGDDIDDLTGKQSYVESLDQTALAEYVAKLAAEDSEAAEMELPVLAPLLDTKYTAVVIALGEHPNFFVREAAAELIAARPTAELQAIANHLANDPHGQVARPGKMAAAAIRRLIGMAKRPPHKP